MSQESEFVTYSHPSGVFSIDIPSDWSFRDESGAGLATAGASASFASPDGQILVRVAVDRPPERDTDEAWAGLLEQFVIGSAGRERGFELDEAEEDDDTLALSYYYEREGVAMVGDAYCWFDDPFAVIFLAAIPDERWDEAEDLIDDIADSLAVEPEASLP
jgi:hypothetical protein